MASWRIHQSLVAKPLSLDKFWPIGKVIPEIKKEFSIEWWEQMKIKHKAIDALIKNKQEYGNA
jgi:hypothetical protein